MNIFKYLRARRDRVLFEKLVFAFIPRTNCNPSIAARDFFELITGRKYIPFEAYRRDARTSPREQRDKQEG